MSFFLLLLFFPIVMNRLSGSPVFRCDAASACLMIFGQCFSRQPQQAITIWCCELHLSPAGSAVTPAQQLKSAAGNASL